MADILVVDDDKAIRTLLSEVLSKDGHAVSSALDGSVAQEKLLADDFDLVITDLNMREVDGITVLRSSKSRNPNTEVLILTGHGTVSSAVEAMRLGAYEYLTKPIDLTEFRLKVKKALERRTMRMQIEKQRVEIQKHQQMLARDLKLAEQVQRSLVPQSFLDHRVEATVRYLPMIGVGGDYADIYYDGARDLCLTLIDVTGHGITAALLVNRLASEIRRLVREHLQPSVLLHQFNNFILESFAGTGMFLTMFVCRLDLETGNLTYAGSAHPACILWRQQTGKSEKLESQNPIIGFEEAPEERFKQHTIRIAAGDKLVMYTDGIIEAEDKDGKALGLQGMLDMFQPRVRRPVGEIADYIIKCIESWSDGPLRDDVMLLVTGIK